MKRVMIDPKILDMAEELCSHFERKDLSNVAWALGGTLKITELRKAIAERPLVYAELKLSQDSLWGNFGCNGAHAAVNLDAVGPARFFCSAYRKFRENEPE